MPLSAHRRSGHGELAEGRYLAEEEIFSPCAAAALYRRDAFVEAGGFDESFFCYAEDIDLGFRLRFARKLQELTAESAKRFITEIVLQKLHLLTPESAKIAEGTNR